MKVLLIVLLIAVILAIGLLAARSRARSSESLPADDHPGALTAGQADDTAIATPPPDIFEAAMGETPLPAEPEPEELPEPIPEPEVVAVAAAPVEPDPGVEPLPEPDPIVEPEPPMEPEPIIEPDPQPTEPEPIIEPDTAGVDSPPDSSLPDDSVPDDSVPDDSVPADPDEPTSPPQAVIDAGELPAQKLDPHAGWETDEDRTIHADPESGLYHTPDSPGYKIGPDGQVFQSEDEAQKAGFTRWDQPDETS